MAQATQRSAPPFQSAELAPVVAQLVDQPDIDLLEWRVDPVAGVGGSRMSGGQGIFRLTGSARAAGQFYPWSVIVKIFSGSDLTGDPNATAQIPSAWNYWKREVLAYQSGILADLAGNLVAARCFGVIEHPNDEWRIWLEDIQETPKTWTIERHGIAARHLGQFNGAFLTGRLLPAEQPWMYRGRPCEWIEFAAPMFEGFQHYAHSDSGRRWLSEHSVKRVQRLLANRQPLLTLLDRLPACLCHHDAFRRNLFARDGVHAQAQTVAIDWSMIGYGGIGAETGITTAVGLLLLEVAGDQAKEFDQITFSSYVAGLRDAGWQGDARLARFGYTATAALVAGAAWAIVVGVISLATAEGRRDTELNIGHKLDAIFAQWATTQPFLLDLGDEALQLANELQTLR